MATGTSSGGVADERSTSSTSSSKSSTTDDDRYNPKFTILQSRNLIPSSSSSSSSSQGQEAQQQGILFVVERCVALCSSMDLIAVRISLESIVIYRTLSWQRLLVVGPSDLVVSSTTNSTSSFSSCMDLDTNIIMTSNTLETSTTASKGITCITWSPDGRAIAVGIATGQVLLFAIEGGIRLVHATARATFAPSSTSATTTTTARLESSMLESSPPPPPPSPPPPSITSSSTVLTRSRTAAIRRQQLLVSRQSTKVTATKQYNQLSKEEKTLTPTETTTTTTTTPIQHPQQFFSDPQDTQVIGLCWAKRVSYNYNPDNSNNNFIIYPQEQERNEAWMIQSQYLNRASHFLMYEPWYEMLDTTTNATNTSITERQTSESTSILQEDGGRQPQRQQLDWNGTSNSPSTLAPLNILCVAGVTNSLSIYLHGRYRIATLAPPDEIVHHYNNENNHNNNTNNNNKSLQIVCSLDLSSMLLVPNYNNSNQKMIMILHDIPLLTLRHHELSWISSSFCFMAANLYKAYRTMEDISLSQWKDVIQPLEKILISWKELFHQYGVPTKDSTTTTTTTVRAELLRYLSFGHCTSNYMEGSAEACHQFFANNCNIHGNEFSSSTPTSTLPRMAKSIENGLVAMEHRIRSAIQASAQALVYSTSELLGLARSTCCEDPTLLNRSHAQVALEISEQLCIITEHCLVDLLRLRHHIRDIFSWLIGEVSYAKAEEEGADPANSKRPSQTVRNRVASFLSSAASLEEEEEEGIGGYETERLLGIPLSEYFTNKMVRALDGKGKVITRPSLRSVLSDAKDALFSLFSSPREAINGSANCIALSFSTGKGDSCTLPAAHKRCGVCSKEQGGTGFRPSLLHQDQISSRGCIDSFCYSRNWLILAQGSTSVGKSASVIQVVALPSFIYDEQTDSLVRPPYYLTAFVELPNNCKCEEVFFYGDDGNSSLSVMRDTKDPLEVSNPEGRQSLGILVEVAVKESENQSLLQQELWILPYQKLSFKVVNFKSQSKAIEFEGVTKQDYVARIVCKSAQIITEEEILCNRRRKICSFSPKSKPSLASGRHVLASGSRGVVGIVNKGKILTLLDVEEDEDVDVSDEENGSASS